MKSGRGLICFSLIYDLVGVPEYSAVFFFSSPFIYWNLVDFSSRDDVIRKLEEKNAYNQAF
jgi:hypothetical protein